MALAFIASAICPLVLHAQQPYVASASTAPLQPLNLPPQNLQSPPPTSADYFRLMEIANEERRQAKERALAQGSTPQFPEAALPPASPSPSPLPSPYVANFLPTQPPELTLGAPGITAPESASPSMIGSGLAESMQGINPQGYALGVEQSPFGGPQMYPQVQQDVMSVDPSTNVPSAQVPTRPPKRFYAASELIWLHAHGDSGYGFSDSGSFGSRGVDFGGRYAIGRVFDDLERIEFVFTGPFEWDRQLSSTGSHNCLLNDNSVVPSVLRSFNNATLHSQQQTSSLSSYELSKQWCADDLSSIFMGLKVIDFSERLEFNSQSALGTGSMNLSNQNLMAGFQLGGLMYRPLSQRLSVGVGGRAGLMLNWARGRMSFNDLGTVVINNRDDKTRGAGLLQLSTVARYYITSRIALLASYEGWYIPGVATNSEQNIVTIAADTPYRIRTNDALFLYGTVLGVEANF